MSELVPTFWQFQGVRQPRESFHLGQKVVIPSNPEHPMIIDRLYGNQARCYWRGNDGLIDDARFPYEMLVDYGHIAMRISR